MIEALFIFLVISFLVGGAAIMVSAYRRKKQVQEEKRFQAAWDAHQARHQKEFEEWVRQLRHSVKTK